MDLPRWFPAYLGLGSNLSDPIARIREAFDDLSGLPQTRLIVRSRLYRSAPMGEIEQPDFINAVGAVVTRLSPEDLLEHCHEIERLRGRKPSRERWGPRPLDIDLLLYHTRSIATDGLILPHPGMHERNFVLYPLAEIAPSLRPWGEATISELAARCGREGLTVLND